MFDSTKGVIKVNGMDIKEASAEISLIPLLATCHPNGLATPENHLAGIC